MSKLSLSIPSQSIADGLRAEILRGELQVGRPLRQDEIAARFGVSKIPVREALMQLRAEGLVTFIPNRGAFISELSAAEVGEIYVMRAALEREALIRAIPGLTVEDFQRAEAILTAMDSEYDVAKWAALNWDFHSTLYSPAGLPRLLETIQMLHANVARYLLLYLAGMDFQHQSQREHRALLRACRRGDVSKALSILGVHLHSASTELTQFLDKQSPNIRRRK